MTHSGFLGISCSNSAKVSDIIIELLLCIRPQNAIKVIKCFPSTVTGCYVIAAEVRYGSKMTHSGVLVLNPHWCIRYDQAAHTDGQWLSDPDLWRLVKLYLETILTSTDATHGVACSPKTVCAPFLVPHLQGLRPVVSKTHKFEQCYHHFEKVSNVREEPFKLMLIPTERNHHSSTRPEGQTVP